MVVNQPPSSPRYMTHQGSPLRFGAIAYCAKIMPFGVWTFIGLAKASIFELRDHCREFNAAQPCGLPAMESSRSRRLRRPVRFQFVLYLSPLGIPAEGLPDATVLEQPVTAAGLREALAAAPRA